MEPAIVDASVALAWVIPDETIEPAAVRLLLAYHGGQVRLLAPSLWEYEIANALSVGVRRERLTAAEGKEALDSLLRLGISLHDFDSVADQAWELSHRHALSVYDAAYLALAQQRECPLYTADRRLARVGADLGVARWIGEFGADGGNP